MKLLRSLLEQKQTVELTQRPSRQAISAAWHEGVLYKGTPIFSLVYDADLPDMLEAKLKQSNESDGVHHFDAQESYLGYVPSKDLFLMGFDTWGEHDDQDYYDEDDENATADNSMVDELDNVVAFRLDEDGQPYSVTVMSEVPGRMFYGSGNRQGSAHRYLHDTFKDLIDIRLD